MGRPRQVQHLPGPFSVLCCRSPLALHKLQLCHRHGVHTAPHMAIATGTAPLDAMGIQVCLVPLNGRHIIREVMPPDQHSRFQHMHSPILSENKNNQHYQKRA